MAKSRCICILIIGVLNLVGNVLADDPSASTPAAEGSGRVVSLIDDDTSQQLGLARQSFLTVDLGAAAKRLRKAADNLRTTSHQADNTIKPGLAHSANELDSLSHRVEKGEVKSIDELDQSSARALHRLSHHHYLMAQRSWRQQRAERTGRQLRAAADSLEHAAQLGRQEIRAATQTVVKDVRLVSGKLVEGIGYGVDEVGRAFESLGQQVESVGDGMEPPQTVSSKNGTVR